MAEQVERLVATLLAVRENDRKTVFIDVYQDYIDRNCEPSGDREWEVGARRYAIRDGAYLNKLDERTFVDPATGARFLKADD